MFRVLTGYKNKFRSVWTAQLVNVSARWALFVRPNEFAALSNAHIFSQKEINSCFIHTMGSDFYILIRAVELTCLNYSPLRKNYRQKAVFFNAVYAIESYLLGL